MTLGTYTHVVSADDKRIAEQLGEILNPSCAQVGSVVEVPAQQTAYVIEMDGCGGLHCEFWRQRSGSTPRQPAETMLIVGAALFMAFVELFYRQLHEAGQEGYNASE